jgi:hypothetical protein
MPTEGNRMNYPPPVPPDQIKTPSTSIGIPENEGHNMNLYAIGALCGIVALVLVLVILL